MYSNQKHETENTKLNMTSRPKRRAEIYLAEGCATSTRRAASGTLSTTRLSANVSRPRKRQQNSKSCMWSHVQTMSCDVMRQCDVMWCCHVVMLRQCDVAIDGGAKKSSDIDDGAKKNSDIVMLDAQTKPIRKNRLQNQNNKAQYLSKQLDTCQFYCGESRKN